jgi:nucleotide-binding universal stress UspA family protein
MDRVFEHVLVATDGSPLGDSALELALRLGSESRVTALLVAHDYGLLDYAQAAVHQRPDAKELRDAIAASGEQALQAALMRATREHGHADRVERRVIVSDRAPWQEITEMAVRWGCDLIVMASHGVGGRLAGPLGSQATAVLLSAKVPVLVTH